jgi:hypothetical protein
VEFPDNRETTGNFWKIGSLQQAQMHSEVGVISGTYGAISLRETTGNFPGRPGNLPSPSAKEKHRNSESLPKKSEGTRLAFSQCAEAFC